MAHGASVGRLLEWLAALLVLALLPVVGGTAARHDEVRAGGDAYWVARGLSDAPMSPFAVETPEGRAAGLRDPFPNHVSRSARFHPEGDVVGPLPLDREQKTLALLIEFATPPPGGPATRLDPTYFDDLLFGTVYDPPEYAAFPGHPTDTTLKNYYQEVSYGQIDVVTDDLPSTIGWIRVDRPYSYYCRVDGVHDRGRGPFPENVYGLVLDAIEAADDYVDFSRYAVDGVVRNLIIVYAGAQNQFSGDPALLRGGQGELSDIPDFEGCWADGVRLDAFAVVPEVHGDPTGHMTGRPMGPWPPTLGAYAHEFGHLLGLCDLYDYGGESDGLGDYTLMAGGSWLFWYPNPRFPAYLRFLGNSPPHLDAWSKCRLGVVTPTAVPFDAPLSVTLPPVESEPVIYRMDVPNSGGREYFLLENRQHVAFDRSLAAMATKTRSTPFPAGRGLAIYHVDDGVLTRAYSRPNEAENWEEFRWKVKGWMGGVTGETHYGVSLVQADDQWHLEHANGAAGDDADLYPGRLGVTRFGSDTFPNSTSYHFWGGAPPPFGYSGVTVDHITEVDGVVTADLSYSR